MTSYFHNSALFYFYQIFNFDAQYRLKIWFLSKCDEIVPEAMFFQLPEYQNRIKKYIFTTFKFLHFVMTSQGSHGNYCL